MKFPKNSLDAYLDLPQKWSYGTPKSDTFEIESRITLELTAAKNTIISKMCKETIQN